MEHSLTTSQILPNAPPYLFTSRTPQFVTASTAELTFTGLSITLSEAERHSPRVTALPASIMLRGAQGYYRYGRTYELVHYPGAQYAAVEEVRVDPSAQHVLRRAQRGGGRRGKTSSTFSKSQRRTMRTFLSKVNTSAPAYFLTLKYPIDRAAYPHPGYPTEPSVYVAHRRSFLRRIEYRHPAFAAIWRLEYMRSTGAPHYHMLLYNLPGVDALPQLRAQMSELWFDVAGFTQADHLDTCAHLKAAQHLRSSLEYLAKRDIAQLSSPYVEHEGSSWGKFRTDRLPISEGHRTRLTGAQAKILKRQMRKYRDKTSNRKIPVHPDDLTMRLRRGDADAWARYTSYLGEHE